MPKKKAPFDFAQGVFSLPTMALRGVHKAKQSFSRGVHPGRSSIRLSGALSVVEWARAGIQIQAYLRAGFRIARRMHSELPEWQYIEIAF